VQWVRDALVERTHGGHVVRAEPGRGADTERVDRSGLPSIGPPFAHGMSIDHGCTASVLDSPAGDLILTAAHCVAGTAAGLLFAPGYRNGAAPYGIWTVASAYADAFWTDGEDAGYDYAILPVADRTGSGVDVEAFAAGALRASAATLRIGAVAIRLSAVACPAFG
jgi:hypothetical protein